MRIAETTVPSRNATGSPVSGSERRITPMPRGSPRSGFRGTLGIHLRPAMRVLPPTYAGIAMIRP